MKLKKRVQQLENKLTASPIVLHFADGSKRELRGPKHFMLKLFTAAQRGANRTARQAEELELIRHTVHADEPGRGHMVELVQAILAASERTYTPEEAAELDRCDSCVPF